MAECQDEAARSEAFWAEIDRMRERGKDCPHSLPSGQAQLGQGMFCIWCGSLVGELVDHEEEGEADDPW